MSNWGRRIRAAVGMGFAWAAAGLVASMVVARLPGVNSDLPLAFLFTPLGFITGLIFSGLLVVIEGRRGAKRMTFPRFAAWGAVSGLLLSGFFVAGAAVRGASLWSEFLVFGPALIVAGAAFGTGSLALVRRAERRALLEQGGAASGPDASRNVIDDARGRP